MKKTKAAIAYPPLLRVIQIVNYVLVFGGLFVAAILLFDSEANLRLAYPDLLLENRYWVALCWLALVAIVSYPLYKIRIRHRHAPEIYAIAVVLSYAITEPMYYLDGSMDRTGPLLSSMSYVLTASFVAYILLGRDARAYFHK